MRHTQTLRNLQYSRFSGQLVQIDATGQQWIFYLSQGSIIYATGGNHLVRRWYRNLVTYFPRIPAYRLAWHADLSRLSDPTLPVGWEYALVQRWVTQQKITSQQATHMINSAIAEVLFDVAQAVNVTDQVIPDDSLFQQLSLVKVGKAIADAEKLWNAWQAAQLANYSPNWAPLLTQPEQLQANSSEQFYQNLVDLLNGQYTLRDLAVKTQRDVVEIASSLLPCFRLNWVVLTTVPDLPGPFFRQGNTERQSDPAIPATTIHRASSGQRQGHSAPPSPTAVPQDLLIACVDDSFSVLQTMNKLITSANYQFVGISDPLEAIGVLLARKPDLIFLDLVMPRLNGYEICEQLRKLSGFRDTPIVILTGDGSAVNRLKSNFVGASDFLSKPLDPYAVLNVVHQYLSRVQSPSSDASGC